MMRKRSHDERRATVARGPRMTSERRRCRVLRRPIEALELAGDPAPTTPRCLSTSGAGGSPSKAPHIITTIAAASPHVLRHTSCAASTSSSSPSCRASPGYTRMPAAKRVPGRRRAPAASGEAGAGLAEGTTGCHSRPSGSARLAARRVGARAWAPVGLRARPPEPMRSATRGCGCWPPCRGARRSAHHPEVEISGRHRRRGSIAERLAPAEDAGVFRSERDGARWPVYRRAHADCSWTAAR